jgi:hypothetical protein
LRVGQKIEIHAQPVNRWDKKGHQYLTMYMAMIEHDEPRVEVWHSAIFAVRPAA